MPGTVPDSGDTAIIQINIPALERLLYSWRNRFGHRYVPENMRDAVSMCNYVGCGTREGTGKVSQVESKLIAEFKDE